MQNKFFLFSEELLISHFVTDSTSILEKNTGILSILHLLSRVVLKFSPIVETFSLVC